MNNSTIELAVDDYTQKEINQAVKQFTNSIVFSNTDAPITDIINLIDNPFIDRKSNDVLSMLFHRFYSNSDIPLTLPVFSMLAFISGWLVKNKTSYLVPLDPKPKELATWVMALAPSGAAKTLSSGVIEESIPREHGTNEPVIKTNFNKPNGPAAFVQNLAGLENGRGLWIQDEASQMLQQIETFNSPMSQVREHLLNMKDNKKIVWQNSKMKTETENIAITTLFINTIDGMARTISEDSFRDGIVRRYQFAMASNDDRKMTDFTRYDLSKVIDDTVKNELEEVFNQDVYEKRYTFNKFATALFDKMFVIFWERQYEKWLVGCENIYRTHLMESWKYAIFHHIIHKKSGTVIDEESMEWGLKVVMFLLNSFRAFVLYRVKSNKDFNLDKAKSKMENIIDYIRVNEQKPDFGVRAVCRKFTLKKEDFLLTLESIRLNNPKFKTKLYSHLKSK
jgi:hypothetical protein